MRADKWWDDFGGLKTQSAKQLPLGEGWSHRERSSVENALTSLHDSSFWIKNEVAEMCWPGILKSLESWLKGQRNSHPWPLTDIKSLGLAAFWLYRLAILQLFLILFLFQQHVRSFLLIYFWSVLSHKASRAWQCIALDIIWYLFVRLVILVCFRFELIFLLFYYLIRKLRRCGGKCRHT